VVNASVPHVFYDVIGIDKVTRQTLVQVGVLFLYAGCIIESLVFHRATHDIEFYRNLGDWILSLSKNDLLGCNESQVITTLPTLKKARP